MTTDAPGLPHEKRPRAYMLEICELPTREERRAALEQVPEHLRAQVKKLVELEFDRRKYLNA